MIIGCFSVCSYFIVLPWSWQHTCALETHMGVPLKLAFFLPDDGFGCDLYSNQTQKERVSAW